MVLPAFTSRLIVLVVSTRGIGAEAIVMFRFLRPFSMCVSIVPGLGTHMLLYTAILHTCIRST